MGWSELLVSGILGIFGGILAIVFERQVRRMLAAKVIKRKLIIGHISKSIQEEGATVFWCIPIRVKAGIWWNLLVSGLEDVKALITFVQRKKQFQTVWINPNVDDSSLVILRIGTEREIGLAEESGGIMKRYGEMMSNDVLVGDDDILLELRTGDTILGQWLFKKAIIAGSMQEVSPLKVDCELPTSHKEGSQT